jgi:hypothetical protein
LPKGCLLLRIAGSQPSLLHPQSITRLEQSIRRVVGEYHPTTFIDDDCRNGKRRKHVTCQTPLQIGCG